MPRFSKQYASTAEWDATWKTAVIALTEERRWHRSSVYVLLRDFFPPGDGATSADRRVFGSRFQLLRPPQTAALSSRMDSANDVFRSLLLLRAPRTAASSPRMGSHNSSQTDIAPPEQIARSKDSGGSGQRR
ncbi:hypothetical protein ABZP36_006737 [Zizania latifolia]